MKSIATDRFGSVLCPESVEEFVSLALSPHPTEARNVRMWRGQANIDWGLDSGAVRRYRIRDASVTDDKLAYYESELIARARHKGFHLFEGRQLSDFEVLARLQHHGAATRLLDATRNCLVALYFACEQLPDSVGLVAGFHCSFLGGSEGDSEDRAYDDVVRDLKQFPHPQTWEPPVVTPRVAAQHSQFLYSAISGDPRGTLWIDNDPGSFLPIAVSPEFKAAALLSLARTFDISHQTLFPDISGFCHVNSTSFGVYELSRWYSNYAFKRTAGTGHGAS